EGLGRRARRQGGERHLAGRVKPEPEEKSQREEVPGAIDHPEERSGETRDESAGEQEPLQLVSVVRAAAHLLEDEIDVDPDEQVEQADENEEAPGDGRAD